MAVRQGEFDLGCFPLYGQLAIQLRLDVGDRLLPIEGLLKLSKLDFREPPLGVAPRRLGLLPFAVCR